MQEQLNMLGGGELVIKRNQHATRVKDGIGRYQPFRLVGHDDCGAITRLEVNILQGPYARNREILEIRKSEPLFFAIAIGLNEAGLIRPALDCIAQGRPQTRILS